VAAFKRARLRRNTKDERGTCRVQVVLLRGNAHKRGNITRSWHVREVRVGELAARLEECLFPTTLIDEPPYS
jgi:hypothetical protein